MVNYAGGFNQSETGKYFECIIITIIGVENIICFTRLLSRGLLKNQGSTVLLKHSFLSSSLTCISSQPLQTVLSLFCF